MEDVASGASFRGIGGKLDRYVIHILDSKSLRNASGQVLPLASLGGSVCWTGDNVAWRLSVCDLADFMKIAFPLTWGLHSTC